MPNDLFNTFADITIQYAACNMQLKENDIINKLEAVYDNPENKPNRLPGGSTQADNIQEKHQSYIK